MNIDNNTVSVGVRGTPGYITDIVSFIALCKQQWGYITKTYVNQETTIDFNVSYVSQCFVVLPVIRHNGDLWGDYWNVISQTKTNFTLSATASISWLSIGIQQWRIYFIKWLRLALGLEFQGCC